MALQWLSSYIPSRQNLQKVHRKLIEETRLHSRWIMALENKVHITSNLSEPTAIAPSFICIHGTGSSSVTYHKFLQHLDKYGIHGIAIDLPGYGISDSLQSNNLHITIYAKLIHEIINKILPSTQKVILLGHSLGAVICSEIIARYPSRINKIICMSPPGISEFRSDVWSWLIKHGIPEHYITFPIIHILCIPIILYITMFGSNNSLFWCYFWLNPYRRNSYSLLSSLFSWSDDTQKYKWLYDYKNKFSICKNVPIYMIWGEHDPILKSPINKHDEMITHYIISDASHNPIHTDKTLELLVSLAFTH
jgi:pimeloyl-ACP methyl ester carboxylesterase